MGIRLHILGVDLPRLKAFLETPLGDVLTLFVREVIRLDHQLTITIPESQERFFLIPNGPLKGIVGGKERSVLTEEQLKNMEPFKRSVREQLSNCSIYELKAFLLALCQFPETNFIQYVIDGERRWWIGSLLQFANQALSGERYNRLVELF